MFGLNDIFIDEQLIQNDKHFIFMSQSNNGT